MRIRTAQLCIFLFIVFIYFLLKSSVFAASINLSEANPSTISDFNQEYQVKVDLSINTSDGTTYYLRGVFYKSGTNDYCGYTWNGSNWYSGPVTSNEGWKNFLQVSISSSSASTVMKAKLDPGSNDCKSSGNYNFKVQRITQGGSGSFDAQNEQSLTVSLPTATPSPVPSDTPAPTVAPTLIPTSTKTVTAIAKPQNTPTKYISPVKIATVASEAAQKTEGLVLGKANELEASATEKLLAGIETKKNYPVFWLFLGSGILFIGAAVIISIKQLKK